MWFVFALVTTALWGFAELFYKKGARPDEQYAHLKICICVGLVMGLHAVTVLLTSGISYDFKNLFLYLPVSLLYIVSMAASFFGMRFLEESISDPIENTSGALCSLLCVVFLKDKLPFAAVIAISAMVVGILGIGFLENRGDTDRKKKIGKTLAVVAFLMPFVYATLDAFGSFLDIYYLDIERSPLSGVTEDNIEQVANLSYELTFAFCAVLLTLFLMAKGVRFGNVTEQGDKIMAAVFETAGQFTYVYAMSGNGAIAAPIISSVCVVSLLLSRIFLKEKLTGKQYAFITLILVGIFSLAVIEGD